MNYYYTTLFMVFLRNNYIIQEVVKSFQPVFNQTHCRQLINNPPAMADNNFDL